ncbi:MAG: hypothetical protein JO305_07135 [Alphaproteobacteria bacterium]|nr:hypothetical protein [Alphaproteobacteria bacterium]
MDEQGARDSADDATEQASNLVEQGKAKVQELQGAASDAMQQARSTAQDLGQQARSAMSDAAGAAQDIARRARDQASAAAGNLYEQGSRALYEQGSRAGGYLSRNVEENPLAALLIAGAVGYGLAYLIHRH